MESKLLADLQIGDLVTLSKYTTADMINLKAIFSVLVINPHYISIKATDSGRIMRKAYMLQELRKVTPAEKVLFGN